MRVGAQRKGDFLASLISRKTLVYALGTTVDISRAEFVSKRVYGKAKDNEDHKSAM